MDFEKLGLFYLGKQYDVEAGAARDELVLYDAKDLTTHAVCVGMTGSGKTGLCLALLEEAAIDGIPAIAIDPKGDLGNLLLTFPQLRGEDFAPWVDEAAALREGLTREQYAERVAQRWREGLAASGQSPERIARFRDAVDLAIYTPGSSAGLPLSMLQSFRAPSPAVREDRDALRDRIQGATSSLLGLLGVDADPVRSREHILIATLLEKAWQSGADLDIAALIRQVQSPPLDRVGVLDLETFFPAKDRAALALLLNNLLASPAYESWLHGEPLDIARLLYTSEGRPRLSIISIAHLPDAQRMFFVTLLLGEVISWMRDQPGTPSLRALLYMDEVFGFFPPVANPPSKTPMLTLLKQARAYGLGIVLATQNPVDLDYKGLSNTGTWLLGRLQTERDLARVLEGLQGAAAQAGGTFDVAATKHILAGLGSRIFYMHNVHEDGPVVFQSRWAMSYLRGPLTRDQIQLLMRDRQLARKEQPEVPTPPTPAPPTDAPTASAGTAATLSHPPALPPGVTPQYLVPAQPLRGRVVYRAALLGQAKLHFVKSTWQVDLWRPVVRLAIAGQGEGLSVPDWQHSQTLPPQQVVLEPQPQTGATFEDLPAEMRRATYYKRAEREFKSWLYQHETLSLWQCSELKQVSKPGQTKAEFLAELKQLAREQRDHEVEALRAEFADRASSLRERRAAAVERRQREQAEYQAAKTQSYVSIGTSLLGALLGRKLASRTNLNKIATSSRSMSRAQRQQQQLEQAEEKLETIDAEIAALQSQFEKQAADIERRWIAAEPDVEEVVIRPRKSDIDLQSLAMVWVPVEAED